MKKAIVMLIVCGMVAALAGCGVSDIYSKISQVNESQSVSSEPEYKIYYAEGVPEVTNEFFLEMRERSNQIVIETMQLTGDDIVPYYAEECAMIFDFEDFMSFITRLDQGSDMYVAQIMWEKTETGEWKVCSIEINDEVYLDE